MDLKEIRCPGFKVSGFKFLHDNIYDSRTDNLKLTDHEKGKIFIVSNSLYDLVYFNVM